MTKKLKRPNNFVYLGQAFGINRNIKTETNRRISQDQCILPVMTYGSKVWNMIQRLEKNLTDAQKGMKRNMLELKKGRLDSKRLHKKTNKTHRYNKNNKTM